MISFDTLDLVLKWASWASIFLVILMTFISVFSALIVSRGKSDSYRNHSRRRH